VVSLIEALDISSSPYVNAALSVVVFVVLAKAIDLLVDKVLRKFSRFTKSDLDDRLIDVIHRPIYFTVILVGCVLAIIYLQFSPKITFYLKSTLYTMAGIIWAISLISISKIFVEGASVFSSADTAGHGKDIIPLIENVFKIVIIAAALMAVLSIWKIDITPLVASAGIAGIAVAIAAKDTLSNFFGGLSVFIDRPYKMGDYVVLGEGERGEVVAIGIRSTRIKTRDDVMITIPNAVIANSKIINESAPIPNYRIRIPASVAYGSDIDLVQTLLLGIAAENAHVLPDPSPRVRFREFGDSALLFELLCWTEEPAFRGVTTHELNCTIYKKFNEAGIVIPFPQRDVHIMQQ
jgi:small-conductance mechanosensitive channel